MAATKDKVLLVGLPRSGTTIVANYINSMARAFCFIEPHREFTSLKSTDFFRDPKLRWIFFLRYQEHAELPMDAAVRRVQGRYDLVGIKETFRGDHYASYDPDIPNEALLTRYVGAGYRLVPILRDPLAVWNSFQGYFRPPDYWAGDLDGFIENYSRFCQFAGSTDPLIYERFVREPAREMSRQGFSLEGFDSRLATRRARVGDDMAKGSTEVTTFERPVRYTPEQREALEASPAARLYLAACDHSSEPPGPARAVDAGHRE